MPSPLWWERIGAAAVLAVGLVLLYEGYRLPLGRLANFGPGLFPLIVGLIVVALGVALLLAPDLAPAEAPTNGAAVPPRPWRPMLFVAVGMIAFALLIRGFGLVPATVALVILASLGDRDATPLTAVGSAVVLSFVGVAIFVWGLGLALVPWRF